MQPFIPNEKHDDSLLPLEASVVWGTVAPEEDEPADAKPVCPSEVESASVRRGSVLTSGSQLASRDFPTRNRPGHGQFSEPRLYTSPRLRQTEPRPHNGRDAAASNRDATPSCDAATPSRDFTPNCDRHRAATP